MFFSDWHSLLRVAVVGLCAYAGLVLLLRVYGKRSLSQFSAFDFVVTVALGSTLATILLSKDVALAEGLLAFAVLLTLQLVVTWLSPRDCGRFDHLLSVSVKSHPAHVSTCSTTSHRVTVCVQAAIGGDMLCLNADAVRPFEIAAS